MLESLILISTGFAGFSCLAFTLNAMFFRRAPMIARTCPSANTKVTEAVAPNIRPTTPPVSILIPVRDEADNIAATLSAILANSDAIFEVIVLDDGSTDATASIVESYAKHDARVRLHTGATLPKGWCGKQFACHQLSQLAKHNLLLFLDADVRLSSDAIARAVTMKSNLEVDLLSGFPRQRVESMGEAWLIPMMHIVLLTYLPFVLMRRTRMVGASAGCGQFMMVSNAAYQASGGHASIRDSLHDGVQLPRRFRAHRLRTDAFDASDIAVCRMYRGWNETWAGLSKNAHEGIANWKLIVPFTLFLSLGYILPSLTAIAGLMQTYHRDISRDWCALSIVAAAFSFVPRIVCAARFDRAWRSVPMLPVCVTLFLTLQWCALWQRTRGAGAQWRGRVYPSSRSQAAVTSGSSSANPSITG